VNFVIQVIGVLKRSKFLENSIYDIATTLVANLMVYSPTLADRHRHLVQGAKVYLRDNKGKDGSDLHGEVYNLI